MSMSLGNQSRCTPSLFINIAVPALPARTTRASLPMTWRRKPRTSMSAWYMALLVAGASKRRKARSQ
eukprot:8434400-Pyramimonas_sp.AAC.1